MKNKKVLDINPETLADLISRHKLNKAHLATKMGMPIGTFKNKLSKTQPSYRFTPEELRLLWGVLVAISQNIDKVCILKK